MYLTRVHSRTTIGSSAKMAFTDGPIVARFICLLACAFVTQVSQLKLRGRRQMGFPYAQC